MTPPITMIVTIHNGHDHWSGCLANLAAILTADDGAILVDDGSDPPFVLPAPYDQDKRFRLISPGRIGRGAALDLAINHASDGIICIQDVDDRSLPERLAHVRRILGQYPDKILLAAAKDDRKISSESLIPVPPHRLYRGNPFHHSSLAFWRDTWDTVGGYDASLPCCVDYDFYLRCLARRPDAMLFADTAMITRNRQGNRHYQNLDPSIYHQTMRQIRNRYRAVLRPPLWTRLYDLRFWRGIW
ncbi:glycosyltransferase family 2 protein [Thalassospira sp.]|uniref:glycosyltransferase family 2 protein n=1 Tax=Thalassospira sp. TaxID=1912094 RepID=UPI00273552BC|nr:glycosyltransferase [Thalassospira sp.]MDP2698711.1 glycosyltransferase [Thalassospira sp.]